MKRTKGKHKIYIVDDNSTNLKTIRQRLLKRLNCEIALYQTAEQCIEAIDKESPDLILSDYNLEVDKPTLLNGDQLLGYLKVNYPEVPVIMYSSVKDIDLSVDLMKTGADDFIPIEQDFLDRITLATSVHLSTKKEERRRRQRRFMRVFAVLVFVGLGAMLWITRIELVPLYATGGLVLWLITTIDKDRIRAPGITVRKQKK